MNISASKMKKKIKNSQPQTKFTGSYKKRECNLNRDFELSSFVTVLSKNRVTSFLRSMKFKSETPFQSMSELSNFCIIKKHTFEISSKFFTNHNIYFGIWRICYCQIDYNKVIKESPIFTVHNFLSLTSFTMY